MSDLESDEQEVIAGSARAAFVSCWADAEEQAGRTYPGQDLMDVAPEETSEAAIKWATDLWEAILAANKCPSIGECWRAAVKRIGGDPDTWEMNDVRHFGHLVAMGAMGHGVSWKLETGDTKLKVPLREAYDLCEAEAAEDEEEDEPRENPRREDRRRPGESQVLELLSGYDEPVSTEEIACVLTISEQEAERRLRLLEKEEQARDCGSGMWEIVNMDRPRENPSASYMPAVEIQTLLFDRSGFSAKTAKAWAKKNGFDRLEADEEKNTIRVRQREPGEFDKSSFKTITLSNGIQAVVGHPIRKNPAAAVDAIEQQGWFTYLSRNKSHDVVVKVDGPGGYRDTAEVSDKGVIKWAKGIDALPSHVKNAAVSLLRGPPWSIDNTNFRVHDERDNQLLGLYDARDQPILEFRDEEAMQAVEDGFVKVRRLHASMVEYANHLKAQAG